MTQDVDAIWQTLLANRSPAARTVANTEAGIYALFLVKGSLPNLAIEVGGLLYVGMTDSSLRPRNHLSHKSSGFSTLRRSLERFETRLRHQLSRD